MTKKIRPIQYLKPNQCWRCRGKLQLLEEETFIAPIDSKGLPIGGETYVDVKLRCSKCGEEYDAVKKGMCYVIAPTLPPIAPHIDDDYNPFYQ